MVGQPLVQAVHDAGHAEDVAGPAAVPAAVVQDGIELDLEPAGGCVEQSLPQAVDAPGNDAHQVRHSRVGEHGNDDPPSLGVVVEVIGLLRWDAKGRRDRRQLDAGGIERWERCTRIRFVVWSFYPRHLFSLSFLVNTGTVLVNAADVLAALTYVYYVGTLGGAGWRVGMALGHELITIRCSDCSAAAAQK